MSVNKTEPMWRRTVFSQFEYQPLNNQIAKWANANGCNIVYGEPYSPDIIAIGCFVSIIDKKFFGDEIYFQYLQLVDKARTTPELKDKSVCIIVDQLKTLELPKLDIVLQIDILQENSMDWIILALDRALKLNGQKRILEKQKENRTCHS